jgi:hypothetical protein
VESEADTRPPERVIGSSLGLATTNDEDGITSLLYKCAMEIFDGGPEKPVRIWSRVGRRPLVAIGNSNGDIPMMHFARDRNRPGLMLLLQHDDAEREFNYSDGAEDAQARAADRGWTTISMANDWAQVFR